MLLGYPVRLGALQQQHHDEIVREFQLLAMSSPESRAQVPGRLLELVDLLNSRFAAEMAEPQRLREQAVASGTAQIDLRYPARPGMREAVLAWETMMREVDDYCRRGTLLALAANDDFVGLRAWTVTEFLRQLDGQQPVRWSGPI